MEVNTINEYYNWLELSKIYRSGLINELEAAKILRSLIEKETSNQVKEWLQLELVLCHFKFESGKSISIYTSTDKDGNLIEFPSYLKFTKENYEYLAKRALSVKNNSLVAHYNLILWNSPQDYKQKNYLQIKTAIDAIYEISNAYAPGTEKDEFNYYKIFTNGFSFALNVNHKVNEFKSIYRKWIFEPLAFDSKMKIILLGHLANNQKLKKIDFNGTLSIVLEYGLRTLNDGKEGHWASDIFKVGLRIAQKIGVETKSWNKFIGDSYVSMAESRKDDDTGMVPMEFYREAIGYYKNAGSKEKVEITTKSLLKARANLKLHNISIPISEENIEILRNFIIKTSDEILELSSMQILADLIENPDRFPRKASVSKLSSNTDNSFSDLFTQIKYDINKNISQSGQESEEEKFFRNYGFIIQCNLQIAHRIFYEGYKRGKINYSTLLEFLEKNSWLCQTLTKTDSGGLIIPYKWISLIAPALQHYFLQIEAEISGHSANYILSIDSLTMKVEGILRNIAELHGATLTIKLRDGLMREKYIEELLLEDSIAALFGEDNIAFFQFFFTKNGRNIRNNVAHTFYTYKDYSPMIMLILICAILKLSAFKLNSVPA